MKSNKNQFLDAKAIAEAVTRQNMRVRAFRDEKGTTWERGVLVPCLAKWHGHIPVGREANGIQSYLHTGLWLLKDCANLWKIGFNLFVKRIYCAKRERREPVCIGFKREYSEQRKGSLKTDKDQCDNLPEMVSREEFERILGKLASAKTAKRKDVRTGERKKGWKIIPPRPDSDQQ